LGAEVCAKIGAENALAKAKAKTLRLTREKESIEKIERMAGLGGMAQNNMFRATSAAFFLLCGLKATKKMNKPNFYAFSLVFSRKRGCLARAQMAYSNNKNAEQ